MNNRRAKEMVTRRGKNHVLEPADSPSRDNDSICDSDAGSPVPFICTQDGSEGETDVVWNFYTPKSDNGPKSRIKNSTPLSSKPKKNSKANNIERQLPRRKTLRSTQKKNELFQELFELNQHLPDLIKKNARKKLSDKQKSESDEDIFCDLTESSPKSISRSNSHCLRKNVLSSKFNKMESDNALESDDSVNECLLKASQVVEDNILKCEPPPRKRKPEVRPGLDFNNDSMDAILNSIKFESPGISKMKKGESPYLHNDSFDSILGNLNDSALDRITQIPCKDVTPNRTTKANWMIKELIVHDGSPSSALSRHNSMPESPTVLTNKPSSSGMAFGRYKSMPYEQNSRKSTVPGDSPIRCTPDEIKRKHQQAREKLLAKRLLPFTSTQQMSQTILPTPSEAVKKKGQFQPKFPSMVTNISQIRKAAETNAQSGSSDIKTLIERKRQEALLKLRRRQPKQL